MSNVIARRPRRTTATRTVVTTTVVGVLAVAAALAGESAIAGSAGASLVSTTTATSFGTPLGAADSDSQAVELGSTFHVAVAGTVTGVTFDKSLVNGGTHTGTLWDSAGRKLATATFTGETASGLQTVRFATPVAVQAGKSYVVSYHTNVGHYYDDVNAFSGGKTIAAASTVETSGVYHYGVSSGFPSASWSGSNYFVSALFTPAVVAPPVVMEDT